MSKISASIDPSTTIHFINIICMLAIATISNNPGTDPEINQTGGSWLRFQVGSFMYVIIGIVIMYSKAFDSVGLSSASLMCS